MNTVPASAFLEKTFNSGKLTAVTLHVTTDCGQVAKVQFSPDDIVGLLVEYKEVPALLTSKGIKI